MGNSMLFKKKTKPLSDEEIFYRDYMSVYEKKIKFVNRDILNYFVIKENIDT